MSGQYTVRGTKAQHEQNPEKFIRDPRTIGQRLNDGLKTPSGYAVMILVVAVAMLALAPFMELLLLFAGTLWLIYRGTIKRSHLPARLPIEHGGVDYNDPLPTRQKFSKARGIFMMGHEIDTHQEIHFSGNDMLTHMLLFGTTGSGKTESLLSLSWNSLSMGSGLIFIDPKGTNKLSLQVWSMARYLGRDDDFLIINYSTGNRTLAPDSPDRVSNTSNPFSHGTADFLSDIMNSLIPSSEGENAVFSERALSLMKTLMMGLVEMRDQGNLNLSVRTIREWMTIEKCMEIMNDESLTDTTRESMRAYLNSVAGFNPQKKSHEQGEDTLKQFGYAQAYFTRALSSLTDTYGHVYGSVMGEVDYRDVVFNRRILVALMPSMEKAPPELKALGKVVLAAIRSAMAMGLGNEFEGDNDSMIESLPSGSNVPNLVIADEYGYVATEGFAVAAAQARGLGFSCIFAGQDYAGFKRGDEKEAEQILANTKVKIIMALEDTAATWDVIKTLSGEVDVTKSEGLEVRPNDQVGTYRDNARAKTEKMSRVDLQDLRQQIEGEFHLFFKDKLIRGQMFHANPDIQSSPMRINRMVEVDRPTQQELSSKYGAIRYLKDCFSDTLSQLKSGEVSDLRSPQADSSIVDRYGPGGDQIRDDMQGRMNRKELVDMIPRREAALVAMLSTFGSYTIDAPTQDEEREFFDDDQVDQALTGQKTDKTPSAPPDDEVFASDDEDDVIYEFDDDEQEDQEITGGPVYPPDENPGEDALEESSTEESFVDDDETEEDEVMADSVPSANKSGQEAAAPKAHRPQREAPDEDDDDFSPALQVFRSRVNEMTEITYATGSDRRGFIDDMESSIEDTAKYPVPPVPKGGAAKESRVLNSLERFRSQSQKVAKARESEGGR